MEPGTRTVYSRMIIRIQTAQGLSAGNISLPWRPDSDELVVHHLLVRRGDQTIDVLAAGQTFTVVRRETNLESATLDGVLTANIQPEGLQVGDTLELEFSIVSHDLVATRHAEFMGSAATAVPVGRAHFRAQWPTSEAVRVNASPDFPRLTRTDRGGVSTVEASADNLQPLTPPRGAPLRYALGRTVELTDFRSWADVGALMAPLFARAAVMPADGPLQAELARIRAASTDPVTRAEAALALVQDRVRYVALAMGEGAIVPTDAATTWGRRYGDCKAKTALLMALLSNLGIESTPVLVSTVLGDGINERLPMMNLFNHVLVRATIAGRTYWLDGTRTGDRRLANIRTPGFGWGLPLLATGSDLVSLRPEPLAAPQFSTIISVDASAGFTNAVPARIEMIYTGDEANSFNTALNAMTAGDRDRMLRDYLRPRLNLAELRSVNATFDAATGEEHLLVDATTRVTFTDNRYRPTGMTLGSSDVDYSRPAGPGASAPFAVPHPYYSRNVQTITLPADAHGFSITPGADVDTTIAGVQYRRHAAITGNVARFESSERSLASEFPASEAPAAEAALHNLSSQSVFLVEPADYRPSNAELTAAGADLSGTTEELLRRGNVLLDNGRYREAMAVFERAVGSDPRSAYAMADRGIAKVYLGDETGAKADLDAAAIIDPRNAVVFRARGLLALRQNDPAAASAAFTTSLEIEPGNAFALMWRATAYRVSGRTEPALADLAAILALRPEALEIYFERAVLLHTAGRTDEAIAQAAAVVAANPDNARAHLVAGAIYSRHGRRDEALRELGRALTLKEEAGTYLARSRARAPDDAAGRREDIDAALRLEPHSVAALAAKAELETDIGHHADAATTWTAALAERPNDDGMLVSRGVAYLRANRPADAARDFAAATSASVNRAETLNTLCWGKATAGVALASALADCNAALALQSRNGSFLDSRAFVQLRLGHPAEAVADYDRALAITPHQAASLFGRAVARARLGQSEASAIDLAAAEREAPEVRRTFAHYGVTLPAAPSAHP